MQIKTITEQYKRIRKRELRIRLPIETIERLREMSLHLPDCKRPKKGSACHAIKYLADKVIKDFTIFYK
jgi:hypothetical protein